MPHPNIFVLRLTVNTAQLWSLNIAILLHPFNDLFSRTTSVCQYQKGKTSLDLNEARDDGILGGSGISWTICKQSAPRSRQITTPTPHYSFFLQAGCSSRRPTDKCQSTEGMLFMYVENVWNFIIWNIKLLTVSVFWVSCFVCFLSDRHMAVIFGSFHHCVLYDGLSAECVSRCYCVDHWNIMLSGCLPACVCVHACVEAFSDCPAWLCIPLC